MTTSDSQWRFEIPWPRGGLWLRIGLDAIGMVIMAAVAHASQQQGDRVGEVLACLAATLFALHGGTSLRRLRAKRNPLVLDADGIWVDDSFAVRWSLPWRQIDRVAIRRGFWRRWVVIRAHGDAGVTLVVPPVLHGDLPPQGLAGLIETFRQKFG